MDIAPSSPEAVFSYVNVLADQNRVEDAIAIAEKAVNLSANAERWAAENNIGPAYQSKQFHDLLKQLQSKKTK